jgi:hypothetical protein
MSICGGGSGLRGQLREMHPVVAGMLIGSVLLGAIGGAVGLVVGLAVHPPTAWFAVLEVGIPAGVLGWILGVVVAMIARRVGHARPGDDPVDHDFAGTPPGW